MPVCELSLCRVNNGGCQDLCFLTAMGEVNCSCRGERILQDDLTCRAPNSSCNMHNEFECGNGDCIDFSQTCDSVAHCKDKSDEKSSYCNSRKCKKGYLHCTNKRCVPIADWCNGIDNCGDNSDEVPCNTPQPLQRPFKVKAEKLDNHQMTGDQKKLGGAKGWGHDFLLSHGGPYWDHRQARFSLQTSGFSTPVWGDAREACSLLMLIQLPVVEVVVIAKSTFIHPGPAKTSCAPTEFRCRDGTCISNSSRCNQQIDCEDASDEMNCSVRKSKCPANFFACSSGRCIPMTWTCDKENDCENGEDETHCNKFCFPVKFECNNHRCISKQWVCDGTDDCGDGSDEDHRCRHTTCAAGSFQCPNTYVCVPQHWLCDGDKDCADGDDESLAAGCFAKSCPAHRNPMDNIPPGLPVLHHPPESTQAHANCFSDSI
ncbi:Low-density lipoprotein receptor-related protein 1 [Varanus komodoensis]|nr:Low-density lipoprotein receptor-related protein 1 [Varanus komodoensis]